MLEKKHKIRIDWVLIFLQCLVKRERRWSPLNICENFVQEMKPYLLYFYKISMIKINIFFMNAYCLWCKNNNYCNPHL